jgi:hypothetical protein
MSCYKVLKRLLLGVRSVKVDMGGLLMDVSLITIDVCMHVCCHVGSICLCTVVSAVVL